MNKYRIGGVAAIVAVAIAAVWAWGYFGSDYSEDPAVAAIERERDKKFAKPDGMTREELRAAGDSLRKLAENLTPEQKAKLWERSMHIFMPIMMTRGEERLDKFLAMSPEEQRRELDKKIDEQLARSDQSGGGDGKPNFSASKMSEFFKKMNDWTTPEQRAKFETAVGMYNQRREERGLEPVGPAHWR